MDANNLIARKAHTHKDVRTSEGVRSGAVFGAVQEIREFLTSEFAAVVFAFDSGRPLFRRELAQRNGVLLESLGFKARAYKGKRDASPEIQAFREELVAQLRQAEVLFQALGAFVATAPGFEGDDVISALVGKWPGRVVIYSTDKDFSQLAVRGKCHCYSPLKRQYTREVPAGFLLQRALEGDSSDDILGVPGVGPVRATELMHYACTDGVEEFLDSLSGVNHPKAAQVLKCAELFRNSFRMMDLRESRPMVEPLLKLSGGSPDEAAFARHCRQYEYHAFRAESRALLRRFSCQPVTRTS